MNIPRNYNLRSNAQSLRRNMTKEERRLWYDFLKHLSVSFRRQRVIGYYIADFYCHEAKLVIELDGSLHYEAEGIAYDQRRDTYLSDLGLKVLRYTNLDVTQNFRGVCADILSHLEVRTGRHISFLA